MYVVMSRFEVANGKQDEVRAAFVDRPHKVDDKPGFVRMEVMNPTENMNEFLLVTYWDSESCWREWYKSHHYHDSHSGMPKGLKLIPESTLIRGYQWLCD